MRGLVKLGILVAVVYFAYTKGLPWFREHFQPSADQASSGSSPTSGAGSIACVDAAAAASETWGSGLSRFVNPPVDRDAWSGFRSGVESRIASARSACGCPDDSCRNARDALGDLASLVSDLDSSVRDGSALPGDLVQRQERIDNTIDRARELAGQGR